MRQNQPFLKSVQCAWQGLFDLYFTQRNFRIHLVVTVCALAAACWLQFDPWQWGMLIQTIGLVLVAEGLNSAVETAVDICSPEIQPLARQAKDMAAGAVLIATICSIFSGLCLFGPPLWAVIFGT
ncbi:MAG: diacylglycerol kinase [Planctomycetaceae bacterium]|jgi:diacylglycerol kinase